MTDCSALFPGTNVGCMLTAEHDGDHVKHLRWARKRNEIAGLEKLCRQEAENGIGQSASCTFLAGHSGHCSWWNG